MIILSISINTPAHQLPQGRLINPPVSHLNHLVVVVGRDLPGPWGDWAIWPIPFHRIVAIHSESHRSPFEIGHTLHQQELLCFRSSYCRWLDLRQTSSSQKKKKKKRTCISISADIVMGTNGRAEPASLAVHGENFFEGYIRPRAWERGLTSAPGKIIGSLRATKRAHLKAANPYDSASSEKSLSPDVPASVCLAETQTRQSQLGRAGRASKIQKNLSC